MLPILCVVLTALGEDVAYTEHEIRQKGLEIMEDSRTQQGHWVHALRASDIEFMENHMGPNGLAFLGFFVGEHVYKEHHSDPHESTRHQENDDLWVEFKRLANDQSWIEKHPEDFGVL